MQSLLYEALKTGGLPNVGSLQMRMERSLGCSGLQLPSSRPNLAISRSKASEETSRKWLSGLTFRPMQRKDLESVHPDQIQFIPSSQAANAALPSAFAMPRIHESGFHMPDMEITSYADCELPFPSIQDEMQWNLVTSQMANLPIEGGVERVACGMDPFSDSEDNCSTDSSYSPSSFCTSDGSDSYPDQFGSLDDIADLQMPSAEAVTEPSVEAFIDSLLDDPFTAQALPGLAHVTSDLMSLTSYEGTAAGGFLNALNSTQFLTKNELQLATSDAQSAPMTLQSEHQTFQSTSSMTPPMVSSQSPGLGNSYLSASPSVTSPRLLEALMSIPTPSSVSSSSSQPNSPIQRIGSERSDDLNRSEHGKSHVAKRRSRPMKDISINPPQLGASGSASLWEFILELLADATSYGQFIRWKDRDLGRFKIYDSQVVAALWGKHKNRTNMNFDKMSRAMRYYYGKNILEKGPDGGRLEYEFRPGSQWLRYVSRNLNSHNFVAPNPNQFSDSNTSRHGRVSRRRSSARAVVSTSPY